MAVIRIKNLLLRTQVGFNRHELGKKQDLLLNVYLHYQTRGEDKNDDPDLAMDYRAICKKIIQMVENGRFNLIEKVAGDVADLMLNLGRVQKVRVEVDKPHALRFAQSVSFTLTKSRQKEGTDE